MLRIRSILRPITNRSYGGSATSSHADHQNHQHHNHSEYNEPTGFLFNRVPGETEPSNPARTIFIVGYLGALALFGLVYYYKPDTSAETAGRKEALRRMIERGQDPQKYKYVYEETWRKQLDLWVEVILGYARAYKIFTIDSQKVEQPFKNDSISRKASPEMIRDILDYMVSQGQAELLPKSTTCLVYWRKPSEWADSILSHIQTSGQQGSILTVYELFQGDDTTGCEFHGLPEVMWSRVLRPLQKANKVAVFGSEDGTINAETGIKFV